MAKPLLAWVGSIACYLDILLSSSCFCFPAAVRLNVGCAGSLGPTQRVEEALGLRPLWELMTHEWNAHGWPVSTPEAGACEADRSSTQTHKLFRHGHWA